MTIGIRRDTLFLGDSSQVSTLPELPGDEERRVGAVGIINVAHHSLVDAEISISLLPDIASIIP